MRVLIWLMVLAFSQPLFSRVKYDTAYLNAGFLHVDNEDIPMALFTKSTRFDTIDAVFRVEPGESLHLTLFNLLDSDVEVGCDLSTSPVNVPVNGHATLEIDGGTFGGYGIYAIDKELRYYGLSTVLMVAENNLSSHVWNLRAFDTEANNKMREGESPNFESFTPGIFTLNTEAYEANKMNMRGMVHGAVNDSIYITFAGSDIMKHAPHFHGYHVEIVHSNQQNHMLGWSKDSFPLKEHEVLTVLLVPHQPGMFPVHDHNLISATTNNNYPGGIMGMLHIMP